MGARTVPSPVEEGRTVSMKADCEQSRGQPHPHDIEELRRFQAPPLHALCGEGETGGEVKAFRILVTHQFIKNCPLMNLKRTPLWTPISCVLLWLRIEHTWTCLRYAREPSSWRSNIYFRFHPAYNISHRIQEASFVDTFYGHFSRLRKS